MGSLKLTKYFWISLDAIFGLFCIIILRFFRAIYAICGYLETSVLSGPVILEQYDLTA